MRDGLDFFGSVALSRPRNGDPKGPDAEGVDKIGADLGAVGSLYGGLTPTREPIFTYVLGACC